MFLCFSKVYFKNPARYEKFDENLGSLPYSDVFSDSYRLKKMKNYVGCPTSFYEELKGVYGIRPVRFIKFSIKIVGGDLRTVWESTLLVHI